MTHLKLMNAMMAAALVCSMLSACGGHSGSTHSNMPPPASSPPPAAPPPAQTNFTSFVRSQVTTPATDASEPADIETIDWTFPDDDNETAYDDILQAAM
jgi:hypothetical protein